VTALNKGLSSSGKGVPRKINTIVSIGILAEAILVLIGTLAEAILVSIGTLAEAILVLIGTLAEAILVSIGTLEGATRRLRWNREFYIASAVESP
jgi:hypothetical protein